MFKRLLNFIENKSKSIDKFYYLYSKAVFPIIFLLIKTLTVFCGLSVGTGYQRNTGVVFFVSAVLNLIYYFYKEDLIIFGVYIISSSIIKYSRILDKFLIFSLQSLKQTYYLVILIFTWYFLIFASCDFFFI
jgi:hypothetical protein